MSIWALYKISLKKIARIRLSSDIVDIVIINRSIGSANWKIGINTSLGAKASTTAQHILSVTQSHSWYK